MSEIKKPPSINVGGCRKTAIANQGSDDEDVDGIGRRSDEHGARGVGVDLERSIGRIVVRGDGVGTCRVSDDDGFGAILGDGELIVPAAAVEGGIDRGERGAHDVVLVGVVDGEIGDARERERIVPARERLVDDRHDPVAEVVDLNVVSVVDR